MIHTASLQYKFRKINLFIEKQLTSYLESRKTDSAFSFEIKESKFHKYLYLKVEFIKLLGKADILESDCTRSIELINEFTHKYLNLSIEDFKLVRIDFRFDFRLEDERDRKVLMNILQRKAFNIFSRRKKKNVSDSSIYYSTKSCQISIYDKEKERNNVGVPTKEYEMSVIRFEFQVLSNHLNYMRRTHEIEQTLESYFNKKSFNKYMKEIQKTIRKGNFYKIDEARKIMKKAKLKSKVYDRIEDVLKDVSLSSLTKVQTKATNGEKSYTKNQFDSALKALDKLGINPILIPKNADCSQIIENPFSKY